MVTLPAAAAVDEALVQRLVDRGMNIARINCAYHDTDAWRRMAGNVRLAADRAGRPCRVAMDLAGPKLRTGPLEPGRRVVTLRPSRDRLGRVLAPARARLTHPDHADVETDDTGGDGPANLLALPVPLDWLQRRHVMPLWAQRDQPIDVAVADRGGIDDLDAVGQREPERAECRRDLLGGRRAGVHPDGARSMPYEPQVSTWAGL